MLNMNWTTNNIIAIVLIFEFGLTQTKYSAIPIRLKSNVQTGPKTQLGGLKLGFFMFLYQGPSDEVHRAPSAPMILQAIINPISKVQFIFIV